MGTSFVEYKGFGFWTRDNYLENWLQSLLNELAKVPSPEGWQKSLMEHWQVQATIDGGCMTLDLDEFLTNDVQRDSVLSLARKALNDTEPPGRRTGELFIDLLSGKLKTTVSSPIDYLDEPSASQARPGG